MTPPLPYIEASVIISLSIYVGILIFLVLVCKKSVMDKLKSRLCAPADSSSGKRGAGNRNNMSNADDGTTIGGGGGDDDVDIKKTWRGTLRNLSLR